MSLLGSPNKNGNTFIIVDISSIQFARASLSIRKFYEHGMHIDMSYRKLSSIEILCMPFGSPNASPELTIIN